MGVDLKSTAFDHFAIRAYLLLFCIASFSDFLDGYVARKTNSESVLGEILDPIADKLLIVFVLIGLSVNLDSYLIGFISAVIISREILNNLNSV